MQSVADLVIHSRDRNGRTQCQAYRDLRLANPVFVMLARYDSPEAQASQRDILAALDAELTGPLGGARLDASCSGSSAGLADCPALPPDGAENLLALIGDDHSEPSADVAALCDQWAGGGQGWPILPLFPKSGRPSVSSRLPPAASAANAEFWEQHAESTAPALLAMAGVTSPQQRIFISYRQIDSAALAIQLFDALSHARFDVFLDHFRIPPGVNFQARLTQELGNKSMALLLESERLGESQWVAHEIAVAKACGLGLLGLLLPGGQRQPSLEETNRMTVDAADFVGGDFDKDAVLSPQALERIVDKIKQDHGRARVARRRMLELSFEGAVLQASGSLPIRSAQGAFEMTGGGRRYRVWLSPLPPEAPDFHRAHGDTRPNESGVVIGLSRLMEPLMQTQTTWLANLCRLRHVDEGQIAVAAEQMTKGQL